MDVVPLKRIGMTVLLTASTLGMLPLSTYAQDSTPKKPPMHNVYECIGRRCSSGVSEEDRKRVEEMKPKPPCSGCHGNTYPKPDDDLGGDSPSPIDPYKNPSRGSLGYPSRGSLGYPSRGSFGYPSGVR